MKLSAQARALGTAEALAHGRSVRLIADGKSMWPLLHAGDELEIIPARCAELRLGDIAVALRDDHFLVAHRIVSFDPLTLRGDSTGICEVFLPSQIVGRVRSYRRNGREVEIVSGWGRWGSLLLGKSAPLLRQLGAISRSSAEKYLRRRK